MGKWGWAIALAAVLICTPGVSPRAQGGGFTPEELAPLVASLEAQGLAPEMLRRILYDPRLQRMDRAVTYNVLNPDNATIYRQFVEPFAIRLAQRYRRRNLARLERVEEAYGVSKDVIVGILLVETQFGGAQLRYRPLEVFLSLILDATPAGVERHFDRMKREYPELERAYLEARLAKKAEWAYGELVALLSMGQQRRVKDLYAVKGSFAGAFGMPQFLPSSYLAWAVDGNDDRRVDLNDPSDAMASIANFLRVHGWRADGSRERNLRAVWEYNHSGHYVNAIMGIAARLRWLNRPRHVWDGPKNVEPFDLPPVTAEAASASMAADAALILP
jgi:membrane-bound lytic murein transglycosylase B